jgi:hypothetical protein
MNESIDSILIGVVASLALVYLGYKVRQDRERLRRIVGIIDADHRFDVNYLLELVDSGQVTDYKLATIPAGHES